MHAREILLQLLTYLKETANKEDKPASRFPVVLISQVMCDARFECKPSELRSILCEFIDLGYNPSANDYYGKVLLENVLQRINK